jgi:translation initiation factor 3 subunit A
MPSEQVRNQLVNMATVLHRAMATINPHKKKVNEALSRLLGTVMLLHLLHSARPKYFAWHVVLGRPRGTDSHARNFRHSDEARFIDDWKEYQRTVVSAHTVLVSIPTFWCISVCSSSGRSCARRW